MGKKEQENGFTLIELLVVMSIIILLSLGAGSILDLNNSKNRVEISAKSLASDIQRARDLTLNRKIDKTCLSLYGEASRGQCLRYKIVLRYNGSSNEYLILPQAIDHDNPDILKQYFPDAFLKIEEGAIIQSPSSQEVLSFDYSPGAQQAVEILTSYSAQEISCDDPSQVFEPIIISDKDENYTIEVRINCRGRVIIQEGI